MSNVNSKGGRSIYAPYLPQMADDGFITENDLLVENVIFVEVPYYQFAKKGDEIRLYFQGQPPFFELITDPINDFPIIFKIPAAPLADGVYTVYYVATDEAGNPSTSPTSLAILLRDGSGNLPPPQFVDAISGKLNRNDVLAKGGTNVFVPTYSSALAGDTVTLSFYVKDRQNQDVPDSQYVYSHILNQSEVGSGFRHLVPENYVLSVNAGYAFARYMVRHGNGQSEASLPAEADIVNGDQSLLPAPLFVDSHDGELTTEDISHGIIVRIQYPGIQVNDDVTLNLRGFSTEHLPLPNIQDDIRLIITTQQAVNGWVEIRFSERWGAILNSGYFHSHYQVVRADNTTYSYIATVFFNLHEADVLSAPEFTAAQGGELSSNTVQQQQGTPLRIAYKSLKQGDSVTAILSGRDSNQQPVAGADYQTTHQVSAAEQNAGSFVVNLPAAPVLAVKADGSLRGQYTVLPVGQSNQLRSLSADVLLKDNTTPIPGDLDLIVTLGAPPTDHSVINLSPYNHGVIYGKPGEHVRVTCDSRVTIDETQAHSYDLNLDTRGQGTFRLFSGQSGSTMVNVVDLSGAGNQVNKAVAFDDYVRGHGDIQVLASSTGAPANGETPCSIYLLAKASTRERVDITKVRVTLLGNTSAQILGYPGQTTADILLKSDHSAEIDIINSQAEHVRVSLTLPESGGNTETIDMAFVTVPKRRNQQERA